MQDEREHDERMVKNIRKGINQAYDNYHCSNAYFAQIIVVAILVGLLAGSWGAFSLAFLIPMALMYLAGLHPILRSCNIAFCVVYTLGWGALGFGFGWELSPVTGVVFGIIGLAMGVGVNMGTYQYLHD